MRTFWVTRVQDLLGRSHVVLVGALSQDGDAGGEVRGSDVGDESGGEALAQAILEGLEVAGGSVGREHELVAGVVEGVEGVKELLFGAGLVLEELDVVQK